eukprot:571043-Pyramimonas_sp.AAC.1
MVDDFKRSQRATVLALDKKHFKNVKTLSEACRAKMRQLPKDLQLEVIVSVKTWEVLNSIIKAFKQWSRKGEVDFFMEEFEKAQKFAAEEPAVVLEGKLPQCISLALKEMAFSKDIVAVLKQNDCEEILKRVKSISKDGLTEFLTSEELKDWQQDGQRSGSPATLAIS